MKLDGQYTWVNTGQTKHLTLPDFTHLWLGLPEGETAVYAVGYVVGDIHDNPASCKELVEVARAAMDFAQTRKGYLTQRRVGEGVFEYRITKRTPRLLSTQDAGRRIAI